MSKRVKMTREEEFEFLMRNHNNDERYVRLLIERDDLIKAEIKKRYGREYVYDFHELTIKIDIDYQKYLVITRKGEFTIELNQPLISKRGRVNHKLNSLRIYFHKVTISEKIEFDFNKINDPNVIEFNEKLDEYAKLQQETK